MSCDELSKIVGLFDRAELLLPYTIIILILGICSCAVALGSKYRPVEQELTAARRAVENISRAGVDIFFSEWEHAANSSELARAGKISCVHNRKGTSEVFSVKVLFGGEWVSAFSFEIDTVKGFCWERSTFTREARMPCDTLDRNFLISRSLLLSSARLVDDLASSMEAQSSHRKPTRWSICGQSPSTQPAE